MSTQRLFVVKGLHTRCGSWPHHKANGPTRLPGWSRRFPGRYSSEGRRGSGRAVRFFHDGEAHAAAMPVFFRDGAPGIFGLLARLERTLHLGRSFDQLVEIHRTEFTTDDPEIAALLHGILLSLCCLNVDFRTGRLELRGFGRVV